MNKYLLHIAPPYSEDNIKALEDGFSKLLSKEIKFDVKPEDSLIGGFVAYIDGKVYDSSFSYGLELFKNAIKQN